MTVRSTRLAAVKLVNSGFTGVFTVPTGWRAILKSVACDPGGATSGTLSLIHTAQPSGATITIAQLAPAGNQTAYWSGWIVMNPSDSITAVASIAGMDLVLSGTLLQLTGQEPL